jgi:tRNA(Ile)-lysidine synthase
VSATLEAVRARCSFPPSGAVTCAVSGGADSLALLVLACDAGLDVTAVHVDHAIRAGSAAEADVVADAAQRFGARFRSERVEVVPGGNLEARARAARRSALGPDALFGHTADDQAETVLLALLRGSGLDGVTAMDPEHHPLLGLRRRETHGLCAAVGLEPVQDPSNGDLRFRRNRVRSEVLPLLEAVAERDVVPLLCRFAGLARDDVVLLDELAAPLDATDASSLATAPRPLARRAVRAWLRGLLPEGHPPDAAAVARVLAVAAGEATGTEVAGGVRVRRRGQRLRADGPCSEGGR